MPSLADLEIDEVCTVTKITESGNMRRRFFDIGLIENTLVRCVGKSPMGDPKAYLIRGAVIALRCEDARKILISPLKESD